MTLDNESIPLRCLSERFDVLVFVSKLNRIHIENHLDMIRLFERVGLICKERFIIYDEASPSKVWSSASPSSGSYSVTACPLLPLEIFKNVATFINRVSYARNSQGVRDYLQLHKGQG